jgi:flavin-dependent dehydrogenase
VPWGPGWALVGDAAMHQDPWSGLGIDMAGVHATFLMRTVRFAADLSKLEG